jgi:cytochrome c-type biogenesis protein CcmH
MMITFIVIATAAALLLSAVVAWPLLAKRDTAPQATWTAVAVVVVLVAGAGGLYARFSNWNWSRAQSDAAAGSPQSMVSTLARRLARDPDDLSGWLLLGRSYSVLAEQQPQLAPLAIRAFERANVLGKGENVDALLGLAEALVTQDQTALGGRAGDLVDKALTLSPQSPKALFYGAAAAIQRRQLPLARQRFVALLAENPPENVKPIIQQQITAIDQALGAAPAAASAGEAAASPVAGSAAPARVKITVTLSPTVKTAAKGDSPLFVFVRDPRAAGPPLAVKRLQAHFPQTVELSSADAMLAGHGMQVGQDVEIVARISSSGGPLARSGDAFGSVAYHVGATGAVTVDIDHLTP